MITITRTPRRPDRRLLKYRQYFYAAPEGDLRQMMEAAGECRLVGVDGDYFEDETGREVTEYEMIQFVSGQEFPVIAGDPTSVLRLGTSAPRAIEDWSTTSANTIAHFLEVVERICASKWYRGPHELTFETTLTDLSKFPNPGDGNLLESLCPTDEETMAVLGYCRQLHAKDRLFSNAAAQYVKHCADERKRDWLSDRVSVFNQLVDSSPEPFEVVYTRRELCQMLMYGAGLLHSTSNDGSDEELKALIKARGREAVVNIVNRCMLDFVSVAIEVYHVVRADFEHWVKEHGLIGPDRPGIIALFTSVSTKGTPM